MRLCVDYGSATAKRETSDKPRKHKGTKANTTKLLQRPGNSRLLGMKSRELQTDCRKLRHRTEIAERAEKQLCDLRALCAMLSLCFRSRLRSS